MASEEVSFLCGVIEKGSEGNLARGSIRLRNREHIEVPPNDPGLGYIKPGRPRMGVSKDGVIWAVYNRPKVKLLRMLERGALITEEVLEVYQPRYLCHTC